MPAPPPVTAAVRARPAAGRMAAARALAPFFCLYVTFGTTLSFLASGAPLILRARGVELADVGLLQVINLPVGLTFLWAGLIDRVRLPGAPHRIGWIALTQGAAIALLAVLARGEAWDLGLLLALAVATCVCVATMDVALEALVVETVPAGRRPDVASAKLAGSSLGGIAGAGLLIGSYDALGWRGAILAIAALNALCLLPMLRYPEARLRRGAAAGRREAAVSGRLRALAPRVLVLGLYFAALYGLAGLDSLVLLDLGVPLAEAGLLTGGLAQGINLGMVVLSGWLVRRVGTVRLIEVSALAVAAGGLLMLAACLAGSPALGVAAVLLGSLGGGGLGVPVFGMIFRWAQGPRPATDYALLFGAAFFAAMPLRVAAPALAGALGWPAYLAAATPLFAAAVLLLRRAIRATLEADRRAGAP